MSAAASFIAQKSERKADWMSGAFAGRNGFDKKAPLVLLDVSYFEADEAVIEKLCAGFESLHVPVCVLGKSGIKKRGVVIIEEESQINGMYERADFVVLMKNSAGKLIQAWSNGVVPICEAGKQVMDFDPVNEKGNSFIVESPDEWGFFAGVVRGLETYKFPYDWRHLVDLCRQSI